jgi:regulator of RNase E activity RraA
MQLLVQISDALLTLKVLGAGYIPDIGPIYENSGRNRRLVAPISTLLFISKSLDLADSRVASNIAKGQNWTELPRPSTVVLVQQPSPDVRVALLGDIIATRLKVRGIRGAIVDGGIRDVESCSANCNDGSFHMWSKGFSAASPTLEVLPWAVDVPLQFGALTANPGDLICADEGDCAVVLIPQNLIDQLIELLKVQKEASDAVLEEVRQGSTLTAAVLRHPNFYSAKNYG